MTVDCLIEDTRWDDLDLDALAQAATDATLIELGLEPSVWEVSVMGCDDARIATLNADFRGKPLATNVLSWPSHERGAQTPGEMPIAPDMTDPELGDIAIAYQTCVAEAQAADKSVPDHVTHLLVHGTLHLLGYDHVHDDDATLMEGLETQILGSMGLTDPYGVQAP